MRSFYPLENPLSQSMLFLFNFFLFLLGIIVLVVAVVVVGAIFCQFTFYFSFLFRFSLPISFSPALNGLDNNDDDDRGRLMRNYRNQLSNNLLVYLSGRFDQTSNKAEPAAFIFSRLDNTNVLLNATMDR